VDHVYEYVTATVDRSRLVEVRKWATGEAGAAAASAGATLWGAWLGALGIGWYDDELVAVLVRPAASPPVGRAFLAGVPGGTGGSESVDLVPTARPDAGAQPEPLTPGGVFAHRWFDVAPEHVEEIVALSAEAWSAFEAAFEARIHGLFRAVEPTGRLLLITRYASVGEWEKSRGVARVTSGDLGAARRNFERRRRLTGRQVVRIAPLLG
jgi:hypothetical protein